MRTVKGMQTGVTLVELMIVLAIMGTLAAIALPIYNEYSENARISAMNDNMTTIIMFEEEERMDSGSYVAGEYDPAEPDHAQGLKIKLGWDPDGSTGHVTYVVSGATPKGFTITAQDSSNAVLHTRTYCRNGKIANGNCR